MVHIKELYCKLQVREGQKNDTNQRKVLTLQKLEIKDFLNKYISEKKKDFIIRKNFLSLKTIHQVKNFINKYLQKGSFPKGNLNRSLKTDFIKSKYFFQPRKLAWDKIAFAELNV